MSIEQVNSLLQQISDLENQDHILEEWTRMEDRKHYEHDMQMYACHSYDQFTG